MATYRVKPGYRHGAGKKYGPGDLVELTEVEAAGFLDKLELVTQEAPTVELTEAEAHAEARPKGKRK